MFDSIILGGGPAGMAAAVYMARQKLNVALFAGNLGGQAIWSSDVENYLGIHNVSGLQLVDAFHKHLDDYKKAIEIHEGEMAIKVTRTDGGFSLQTDRGAYPCKTILIATGAEHRKLNVPGETELDTHGISYCATCDAPLFGGKNVFVIGGGNSAMDAALFLAKYASSVTMVCINPELTGDEGLKRMIVSNPKINVALSTKTLAFLGKGNLTGIKLQGVDGVEREESCEGAFIEIGLMPIANFIDFVGKDKSGQIMVDSHNRTNVEGVWAAGDVTDVAYKQISVAVGEGSKASLDIIRYLQKLG